MRRSSSRAVRLYRAGVVVALVLVAHGGRPHDAAVDVSLPGADTVIDTAPESDSIIGYSGPSRTIVGLDASRRIVATRLVSSGDTREHVAAVRNSAAFWEALRGLHPEDVAKLDSIDGVSGATLTSLAVVEGLKRCFGGTGSLRFPEHVAVAEVVGWFPEAVRLERDGLQLEVLDANGRELGRLARSSPYADGIVGYAGPTDTLVAFSPAGRIAGVKLRRSYDTEPYTTWVRTDPEFLPGFTGLDLAQLDAAGVEGVSGATMTSRAIAEGLERMARTLIATQVVWRGRDTGTALVVVAALAITLTRLRRPRRMRIAFQAVVIVYLGCVNGDLLSLELVTGWARHGVAWRLAPGLALLAGVSLVLPLTTRRQVYCHALCPHGALQELVRGRRRFRLPRILRLVPGALLVGLVLATLLGAAPDLAAFEPFAAYTLQLAGAATIVVALIGLLAARFVPMAYCRYGCPTGALLSFLRPRGPRDRFALRDAAAALCLAVAALARFAG